MNTGFLFTALKLSGIFFICLASVTQVNEMSSAIKPVKLMPARPAKKGKKPIADLTLRELWKYYKINPCYLPLLKDTSLWQPGTKIGFDYQDLINDMLPEKNPFSDRYLVGDFNVMDEEGNNKGIRETYPVLSHLNEFSDLPAALVIRMDTTRSGTPQYQKLLDELKEHYPLKADSYNNFLEKVWQFRMLPINREYSIDRSNVYFGGQSVIMCEACGDTLIMVGKFATSSKRNDIAIRTTKDGRKIQGYCEYFPVKKRRKYYAGLNRITNKNWETGRKYEKSDKARDSLLGGGNHHVTYYKGRVELSNFLTIHPDTTYPDAMHQNGIHEVALRGLARGMLGTPNSIGCIRVSDFGSKFLRWWVPQDCKFFISYDDDRYHKKVEINGSILDYIPFKTQEEGDRFRAWITRYRPREAKIMEIDETGDFQNGYIIDAYYALKDDYEAYLKRLNNTSGKK